MMGNQFKIDKISDKGHRAENEDNYWVASLKVESVPVAVACVCDGMGGLAHGREASATVVKAVRDYFYSEGDYAGLTAVLANLSVDMCNTHKQLNGNKLSGTTCTILVCAEGVYKIFHIGDTRCYRYSRKDNQVKVLTQDHTMINAQKNLVMQFENCDRKNDPKSKTKLDLAFEAKERWASTLTRCIGVEDEPPVFDEYSGTYDDGDIFLVASDGFWHNLKGSDFAPDKISNLPGLVAKFVGMGESDNMTAVVINILDPANS